MSRESVGTSNERPGQDQRYATDYSKLRKKTGWVPKAKFDEALNKISLIKANYLWLSLAPQMILKLLILLNGYYVKKA